ncbi:MAG: hypothetical protein H6510_03725 [Acidobacteria bacterium]|nr:hypothetical protein [Acidobacteriota bacterium]MCB9396903.1 hypothetical protein [Acidobacteriota bacterium]
MERRLSQPYLTWTLAKWTMLRILRRKSTYFFLGLGLLPCLQIIVLVLAKLKGETLNTMPYGIFIYIVGYYFFTFFLLILSLFMGLGVVNDELDSGNYVFLRVRPIGFLGQVAGRFLGYWMLGSLLIGLCLSATYFTNMIFQIDELFSNLFFLARLILFSILAFGAYLAVVTAFGTTWKWFSVLASCLWLGLDIVFSLLPANTLQAISIRAHLQSLAGDEIPRFIPTLVQVDTGNVLTHTLALLSFIVLAWLYATFWLSQYETKKANAN